MLRWHQDHHSGDTINRVNKAGPQVIFTYAPDAVRHHPIGNVRLIVSFAMLIWYSWWGSAGLGSSRVLLSPSSCAASIRCSYRWCARPMSASITSTRPFTITSAISSPFSPCACKATLQPRSIDRFGAMKSSFWPEVILNEGKWWCANFLLVLVQAGIVGSYVAVHLGRGRAALMGSVVAIFQYLR